MFIVLGVLSSGSDRWSRRGRCIKLGPFFFFFSSRRRHTRCLSDWSSDVCSSDLLLGAYVTYIAHSAGLPVWLGMVAAPFVVGALGFVLERLIVRRFYAAPIVAMLGTYALGLIIREVVRTLIGGLYRSVPEPIAGSL